MRVRLLFILFFLFINIKTSAQKNNYSVDLIPENLKTNTNSVIRDQKAIIEIISISKVNIKNFKAITVFNKNGLSNIDAFEYFDKSRVVKSIEATVYSQAGVEIKKIKRKDFVDVSVAGDAGDITDSRVLHLNYTPTEYPFTLVYESEVETSNTAFLPKWYPINDFEESVQKSEFQISFPSDLGFKFKEINFEKDTPIQKKESVNRLVFSVENVESKKLEDLSSYEFPYVIFGLDRFYLEGVEGNAKTWKDFGIWMNEKLLLGNDELSEETKKKILELTSNTSDIIEKSKIVYKYVQDKNRYVSIQLGIGGWKPMLAKNVDRLGYGDCKALTNYTKALLKIAGIDSYYTIIYGDRDKKDLVEDFVSMQGNHVILAVPIDKKYVFLECTSQTEAFGFQGNFTDDRLALIVKPDGGEIIRTNHYIDFDNSQITKGNIIVNDLRSISGNVQLKFKGNQYVYVSHEEFLTPEKLEETLKYRYSHLNGFTFNNFKVENNRDKVEFTENFNLSVKDYLKEINGEWVMNVNVFNQNSNIPKRYRTRKTGFKITHGFYDEDKIEILIPSNKKIIFKPEKIELENKFGKYLLEITILNDSKILFTRKLLLKKGKYESADYELYRQFREQIAKSDNSKLILK